MDQPVALKIDGRDITVPPGTMLVDAAKRVGIVIPTLCNHEKLLPAGLCRLCLVEIEKVRGLQPACSTVVRDGMVVHTATPPVLHNRRMVLELLCTNHPLDCPVCDAAGDCHLQDYVFQHGRTDSRFVEQKRHKGKAIPLGPAVILDQERCVLCQRCVRFCEEVLDDRQLAVFQRGAQSRIGTLPGQQFDSAFSGNVVDLCPVGAMTGRVFRFKARSWELQSTPSTCALCPVGCRLTLDTRMGRVLRVRGREAAEVNDGWLCDLGRTGFACADHPERLRRPLVRRGDSLQPATWEEALDAAARGLRGAIEGAGPRAVAALGSPRLTNEAAYLLSRLVRVLGSNNVASCPGTAALAPAQATLADLRRADVIVLFQGDPSEEAPILELWIEQAVKRGARLYIVNSHALRLGRYAAQAHAPRPGTEAVFLGGVLAALGKSAADRVPEPWHRAVAGLGSTQVASLTGCGRQAAKDLAAALASAERGVLAYGAGVCSDETVALLVALAVASGARLLGWGAGPNDRGVADMGLVPDRLPGHSALDDAAARGRCEQIWGAAAPRQPGLAPAELWPAVHEGKVQALYLAAADPLGDAPDPAAVRQALEAAPFVLVQDAFLTPTAALADVVLPAAVFAEEDGSATNLAGLVGWQQAAVAPLGEARPHWRIVADLARRLGAPGPWGYDAATGVLAELARAIPPYAGAGAVPAGASCDARFDYAPHGGEPATLGPWTSAGSGDLALVTGPLLFDRDLLAAHAGPVAARAPAPYVALNPADAEKLGVVEGSLVEVQGEQGALRLQARLSEACLAGTAFVPEQLGPQNVNLLGARPGVVAMVAVRPAG